MTIGKLNIGFGGIALGLALTIAGTGFAGRPERADGTIQINVTTNKSCMAWHFWDITGAANKEIKKQAEKCAGYYERGLVRGDCTIKIKPAKDKYQFWYGGQFAYSIDISDTGLVTYRRRFHNRDTGIKPGQNSITFQTSKLKLQYNGFKGFYGVENESLYLEATEKCNNKWRNLGPLTIYVVKGAKILVSGQQSIGNNGQLQDAGSTFNISSEGELIQLGNTQRAYLVGTNPHRIMPNPAVWNFYPEFEP